MAVLREPMQALRIVRAAMLNAVALPLVLLLATLPWVPQASAAEVRVISGGAVKDVVSSLAGEFTRSAATPVRLTFSPMGGLKARLAKGEQAELLIATPVTLDELLQAGTIRVRRAVPLAQVGVGVAARAGGPNPSIGTPEELKRAILGAPLIAHADPKFASSGIHVAKVLARLGVEDAMRGRIRVLPDGTAVVAFIAEGGGNALGIAPISEIRAAESGGVRLLGPLPGAFQSYTVYHVALLEGRAAPEADALFNHLASPGAQAAFRAAGLGLTPP